MDTVYYHLIDGRVIEKKIARGDNKSLKKDLQKYYYHNKRLVFFVISLGYLFIFLVYKYGMCNM